MVFSWAVIAQREQLRCGGTAAPWCLQGLSTRAGGDVCQLLHGQWLHICMIVSWQPFTARVLSFIRDQSH